MKLLRIVVALVLVIGLFGAGAVCWRAMDSSFREATAIDLLSEARAQLEKGHRTDAVFLAGSATAHNPSAFVLLAAGDILFEANERELARDVLVRALASAEATDPNLQRAIENSLDRVGNLSSQAKELKAPGSN